MRNEPTVNSEEGNETDIASNNTAAPAKKSPSKPAASPRVLIDVDGLLETLQIFSRCQVQ